MVLRILSFLIGAGVVLSVTPASATKTLQFGGHTWTTRSGNGLGPGPNNWSDDNVWIDSNGYLHLKIAHAADGSWSVAQMTSTDLFDFGRYQIYVIGRIDQFDPN